MNVLITGAGLIGSQVASLEQQAGRTPVLFDVSPRTDALADVLDLDRCVVVQGSVLEPLEILAAVSQHDVSRIVHTAAYAGLTGGSVEAPLSSTVVNVVGTANVLEVARMAELARVVVCSSAAVYRSLAGGGDRGAIGAEEAFPRPTSIYGVTKQAAESLGLAYTYNYGLDVAAVRLAAVFGPWGPGGGGDATRAMEGWLRCAVDNGAVRIDAFWNDWIYSKDAARGMHLACWADALEDRVFNLGMGVDVEVGEVIAAIEEAVPGTRVHDCGARAAASAAAMPIDRARQQLGFTVDFPMGQAVADYVAWIERHPKGVPWPAG